MQRTLEAAGLSAPPASSGREIGAIPYQDPAAVSRQPSASIWARDNRRLLVGLVLMLLPLAAATAYASYLARWSMDACCAPKAMAHGTAEDHRRQTALSKLPLAPP